MGLIFGDPGEDRQLLGLLESAQAQRHRSGLGGDDDHRRVRPVRGRTRGDEVRDARAVLRDAYAVAARHSRVAVGHVPRALLVRHRDEAYARQRKEIERIHVRGADDPEYVLHALRDERFDECFRGRHLLLAGHGEVSGFGHGVHGDSWRRSAADGIVTARRNAGWCQHALAGRASVAVVTRASLRSAQAT